MEHLVFIADFFFNESTTEEDEEQFRNLILSSSKYKKGLKKIEKSEYNTPKSKKMSKPSVRNSSEPEYPIYIKELKVNETNFNISFFYSELLVNILFKNRISKKQKLNFQLLKK